MFAQEDGNDDFEKELEQYQRGYLHAMDDVQRKIKWRNIDVVVNKGRPNSNHPSTISLNTENKTEKTKEMKQMAPANVEKVASIFNM